MRVRIRKWYLDCSAPTGAAAVVYVGRVILGRVSVPYAEVLVRDPSSADVHAKRLAAASVISDLSDRIVFESPVLDVSGTWRQRAPEFSAILIDDPSLRIEWRCRMPRADVSIRLPGGRVLEGAGYAEHLSFDGTTAGLPFRRLRWGRFIGGDRHVIWIDWDTGVQRRWVFVDGHPVQATVVTGQAVEWPGGRLEIDPGLTMRNAPVADTIAGRWGRWLPRGLASATESKWAGPARLIEGAATVGGRVIHEVLQWP